MAFARSTGARMDSINVSEIATIISEQYGVSRRLADAIAAGALSARRDAIALARDYRLIAPVDTTEARAKGLVQ